MSFFFFVHLLAALFSFFVIGAVLGAAFSKPLRKKIIEIVHWRARRDILLARTVCNPILSPGSLPWTAEAVLNPAALVLGGRTHLLYRAIGMDGVSRLGYASSAGGIVFDDRPTYPAYVAQSPRNLPGHLRRYSPVLYPSGGSWGGCEDPRMVAIGDRVYVTYNAFDGWDFIRVAYISLSAEDFLAKRFGNWSAPRLLSRPGERHKNWVLFPEKINGAFALLHNLHAENPDAVRVEYVHDLDTFEAEKSTFESPDPQRVPPRAIAWHHRARSAGPPPVKTDRGWLVLYHATSETEGHRYKLGALLLDRNDPTRVIARAAVPVLSPDASYENEGKPGIVYACGAVVHDDLLYVYYGGADKVVCVAMAPIAPFINALIEGESFTLEQQSTHLS